ncbi:hypothetical protein KUV61_10705 [Nocardioides marinus]|nr:hypothetical protein [Nocardioides marinus]
MHKNKFLKDNPFCIYCGGASASTTWDHMPNKGMFPKDRPGGMEFPCCEACNQGSKWFEDIVSALGGIVFNEESDYAAEHFAKRLEHLFKSHPEVRGELSPYRYQAKNATSVMEGGGAMNLQGPIVSQALLLYGAKLALALHWKKTGLILPSHARIGVICFSNEQLFNGGRPSDLFDHLPEGQELRKGKNKSRHSFLFSSAKAEDSGATAHWAVFGDGIAYNLFVGEKLNVSVLPKENRFSPGCLQIPKPKPVTVHLGWSAGPVSL